MGNVDRQAVLSFRDLRVWRSAMDLVESVYRMTQGFPKHETYGLCGQMQRAAVSVPSNIAEGHTREHLKEYLQHVSMAQGSLAELQTQAEIAARLGYIDRDVLDHFEKKAIALAKQLYSLRNSLAKTTTTPGVGG